MRTTFFLIAEMMLSLGLAVVLSARASGTAQSNVVLGSKVFSAPYGNGFGTSEPKDIFNGGDPSGHLRNIHWHGWGQPIATGTGETPIFKPNGGYYDQLARIELRASKLARCTKSGPLAYTRLEVREPSRPGGPLGKWFVWSDQKNLCNPPS